MFLLLFEQEFGSFLSGLSCPLPSCDGVFLPIEPLNLSSAWKCNACGREFSSQQIGALISMQGVYLKDVDCSDPKSIIKFLAEAKVPPRSKVAVQLKACLIWKLGHIKNFSWPGKHIGCHSQIGIRYIGYYLLLFGFNVVFRCLISKYESLNTVTKLEGRTDLKSIL